MAVNRQEWTYAINADTSKAKKQIADLFKSLDKVQKYSLDNFNIAPDLVKASHAAEELAGHLRMATNVNTGQLDLAKFNQSIRNSNTSLTELISNLGQGGSAGQAAFEQMTAAIARTQVPLRQTSALLKDMATTLKNTIKWELSSTAVHGLESALSGAVSYAKNLNTSLTNIRIVTGQSVEDMARFTKEANAAAKALSTTTKSYADASLIYYQQGDSQEMAAKKAAITIKAANASFETSAKEMSEYLTSVWNSYQVGADELERYVDIMANLGAKTATSLEEIATSMQKVAATSNTVGVSMEQVSSIIATVSSVTRESAESIGTSYKTIFARIGDLKLGKADEDGIGLGQVSSQLDAIGVKILDESGNLREMGDIIMDLGTKWQTMNQAQKTAVAQVVAGKRQYTQLMALFENWDMFQANLNLAENSEGALQGMADIYAESWEAASARVQASMEGIFNSLINDQGLIKLTNFTADFVDGIGGAIDGIGGLNGVLRLTGSLMMKSFGKEAGARIKEIGTSMKNFFIGPKAQYEQASKEIRSELISGDYNTAQVNAQLDLFDAKQKVLEVEKYLSSAQKETAQNAITALGEQANKIKELEDEYNNLYKSQQQITLTHKELANADIQKRFDTSKLASMKFDTSMKQPQMENINEVFNTLQKFKSLNILGQLGYDQLEGKNFEPLDEKLKLAKAKEKAIELQTAMEKLGVTLDGITAKNLEEILKAEKYNPAHVEKLKHAFGQLAQTTDDDIDKINNALDQMIKKMQSSSNTAVQEVGNKLAQAFQEAQNEGTEMGEALIRVFQELGIEIRRSKDMKHNIENMFGDLSFEKITSRIFDLGGGILDLLNSTEAISASIVSWGDDSITTAQKLGQLTSATLELASGAASLFSALGGGKIGIIAAAIGIAATVGAGIISGNKQKDIDEARANQEKYRESGFKVSESTREEIQANQDLLSSYSQLLSVYDETKTNQAELIESAYALADAYGLVGDKALIAAGKYDDFNNKLLEAQKKQIIDNIADFDTSISEIRQSVMDKTGGYYDIESKNLYSDFEKNFKNSLQREHQIDFTLESQKLQLNPAWAENTKIGGRGGRADQVFDDLYRVFQTEEYQNIINPNKYTEDQVGYWQAIMGAIEQFARVNAIPDFQFDGGNAPIGKYANSGGQVSGYKDFREQFISAFKDVNNVKVSEAYSVFNKSGILRKDNITEFLDTKDLGITDGIIDTSFFDQFGDIINESTGGISWNEIQDFDQQLAQYQKYKDEVVPAIKKKQSEVQAEMAQKDKDSDAYKTLETYSEYLNNVLNDIELITGADSKISETFELYLSDVKARDIERAKLDNLDSFLKDDNGKYRTSENTTLSDFMKERVEMEERLSQNAGKYETLKPYLDDSGKVKAEFQDEYNQAVNDLIAAMVQGTDLTELFEIDSIIKHSVKPENQTRVTELLVEKGIETADEVSGLLLQVISGTWDESAELLAGSIIDANKQKTKANQAVAEYEQFAAAGKLFKSDMNSQDRAEFSNVFFNSETSKKEIDDFINMSFEERETYIENKIKEKEQNMINELDAAAQADETVFQQAKSRAEEARLNLGLEAGEIDTLLAGYAWNEEKKGYYSAKNPETAYTGKLADKQAELHEYENYVAQMKTAEQKSILSYGEWQMAKATIEDTMSALEKLQNIQSKIGVDLSNLPKKGTDAWKRLREEILKTGKDLEQLTEGQQIDAISDAQIDNLDAQIAEKEKELANTESESTRAEIESAIAELRDQKDQVLINTAEAYEALNNQAIAGISSKWEQANKLAEKKQEIAQILSSAVDSGIISNEEAALVGYTAEQWAQYSIEVRAAIAAQKTLEGSRAVQEQLEQQKQALANASTYLADYADQIDWWRKNASLDELFHIQLDNNIISPEAFKEIKEAYDSVISEFGDRISTEDLITQMSIKLGIDKSDLESQIAQVAGAGKDAVNSIFATMSQELKEKAQEAVDAWLSAFDTIAEARKTLLEGGSLIDQLAGDPKKIQELFQNFDGAWEEFTKGIIEGTIKADDLKTPEITESYLQDRYAAAGVATLTGSNEERRAAARKQLEAQNTTGEVISEEAVTEKVAQDYETAIKGLVEQGIIKMSDDQIKADAAALAKGEHAMGDALLAAINEYLSQAQERINFSEQLRSEGQKREETAIAVQEAADTGNLVINANGAIQVDGETIEGSKTIGLTRNDGQASFYEEYQQLQAAIDRAQEAKASGESWETLAQADQDLLAKYDINFDNVDQSANACATALAACAEAAYNLAMAAAGDGYKYDEELGYHVNEYGQQDDTSAALDTAYQQKESAWQNVSDVNRKTTELHAESADFSYEELENYTEALVENGKIVETNKEKQMELAAGIAKQEKAISEAKKSFKDWDKVLNNTNSTSEDITRTVEEMREAYEDMFHLTEDESNMLPDTFFKSAENAELLKRVLEDDAEAWDELQAKVAEEIIIQSPDLSEQMKPELIELTDIIANYDFGDMEVGTAVDLNGFKAGAAEMIYESRAAAEAASAALSAVGVDADIVEHTETAPPVTRTKTVTGTISVPTIDGTTVEMTASGTVTEETDAADFTWYTLEGAEYNGGGVSHPSGGGGGSSGGNGGGGGSPQKKEKKKHKRTKDHTERYHENNEVLKRVGEELDKIDKLKSRAFGKNYVDSLNAETEALKDQKNAYQALKEEAEGYMQEDRGGLENLGATFDAEGNISNYEELVENIVEEYNRAVDIYNNSEQNDGDKENLEAAEEAFDDAMQLIDDYEEALAQAAEAGIAMEDILNQISEIELEKITYELEVKLDLNERDIALLEYYQEKYESYLDKQDDIFNDFIIKAAEYESNLGHLYNSYGQLIDSYLSGDLLDAQYAEGLQEIQDQILDNLSELNNIQNELADTYANTLSMATEEIEKMTDALDDNNSTLQSYMDIVNLLSVNGPDYKTMDYFYTKMNDNNLRNLNIQKKHYDALLKEEDVFKQKLAERGELTELEQKEYEALQEEIRNARDTLTSTTQEAMELVQAQYENTINGIADSLFNFSEIGAYSLEHLQDQYGYFQEQQERYVSTARALTEVSKLNRDIEGQLAQSVSASSKEALKALQEKINKQAELNKMTEYDIEMNQLQYQLLLARIKLEEAENAKDVVRLTRDDNGNYAYQYTANQDKLDEAAQEYEDVLQQINDSTVQQTSEIEQKILNTMADYKEKLQEVALDYSLSEEERYARMQELSERFQETMYFLEDEYQTATSNLGENQAAMADHYGVSLETIMASTAGNVNSSIASMVGSMDEYVESVMSAFGTDSDFNSAWTTLQNNLQTIAQVSGLTFGNMTNDVEEMETEENQMIQQAEQLAETLTETLEPINNLTEAWNNHYAALQNAISGYENLALEIQEVLNTMSGFGSNTTNNSSNNPVPAAQVGGPHAKGGLADYTGLAWLDGSKENPELVLNPDDTRNMLKIVDSVRQLDPESIAMLMDSYKINFASLYASLNSANVSSIFQAHQNSDVLEQYVTITAEFPNASDRNEIKEVFDGLINRAAQFASRKK